MDESAVTTAYRMYARPIWRRCYLVLRDDASAMDVTQEVFVRCFRHHRDLRTGRELLGWLYRVATNLCLNHLRDRHGRGEAASVDSLATAAEPTREPDAIARLMTAEILFGLDLRSQEIAFYVYVDGMTHAEAAEVAGVSERTVRYCLTNFLEHGRKKLGVRLQEET
jgi:RNA polymerase sigma-70 factor (ECF subfamily)